MSENLKIVTWKSIDKGVGHIDVFHKKEHLVSEHLDDGTLVVMELVPTDENPRDYLE